MNVARLALAQIQNPYSMKALGSSDYVTTANTATPIFGDALTLGTRIVGSALEQSTTDMAAQLTNLTVYQRAYEASSKALTTNDQMLQQLFQLVT
jgi:flagellar hook protein FlgE